MPDGLRVLDQILMSVVDGEWHRIDDLSMATGVPEPKLRVIIDFLSEHGFVHRQDSEDSIRLDPKLKTLMEI